MKGVVLTALLSLLSACGGAAPPGEDSPVVPRGARILEIDITPAASGDYGEAFRQASSLGMQSTSLSLDWTVVETGLDTTQQPAVPVYQADPDLDYLAIADFCYPRTATRVTLTLRPVVTLVRDVPPDLQALPLDDPRVIRRFEQLIDHVLQKLPNLELSALIIGSEVDLYLTDEARRNEWRNFYRQVAVHARESFRARYPQRPVPPVGFEVTHEGLLGAHKPYYRELSQYSDLVAVSYYPMDDQGQVQDPQGFARDVEALRAAYPGKPLYFLQLGYPSGFDPPALYPELGQGFQPSIGSSARQQAEFIDAVFETWDRHADAIPLIDFTWLHDLSPQGVLDTAANPAFGGSSNPDPRFYEFLRTLGLGGWSSVDGRLEKPAWERLRQGAAARGWPQSPKIFCQ